MKNKLIISALLGIAIASCSRDDDNFRAFDDQSGGNTPTTPTTPTLPVVQTPVTPAVDPSLEVVNISGNITENTTYTKDKTYILTGAVSVKSGATLTLEPGTIIRAVAGGSNTYLAVEPGAKIIADGTAAEPIRFTSNANVPSAGDWGGILIVGNAPISGGGTSTTEVLPLQYGGTNSNDNSGILDYVLVEFTGARIGGEQEFNGFTFYAVGDGTQVSNIAALYGDDDAIEFFGGTVNLENVLVANSRDDLFDWTQGWTGTAKNIYGTFDASQVTKSDDPRGIEGDGNLDGKSPEDIGQSNPTIENITIINNSTVEMADLIKIRRGSNATITGAYLAVGPGSSASDLIDLNDGRGNAVSGVSITGTANSANGLDITDIKNEAGATITITEGTIPSVDKAIFDWVGFTERFFLYPNCIHHKYSTIFTV